MSLVKFKMKYQDILDIADAISENELIFRPGMVLEYPLDAFNHKKLNEELYIRTKGPENGFDLEYHDVIELEILDINFKFTIADDNNTLQRAKPQS